ncbi:hypothetical protein RF11_00519 [Thelohanellus kitauei]|uniref:Uncharacterized protein n=1 Tax=Thelohanellus kitauei TaxID=669202 RepID=A0A0C2NDT2_THEKT|nr:hypothetical protein RF11_00519 [Thelohanellus kitauei]
MMENLIDSSMIPNNSALGFFGFLSNMFKTESCMFSLIKDIEEDFYMSSVGSFAHKSPKHYFYIYRETLDFMLHFILIVSCFISYVFACFGFCGRSTSRTFVAVVNFFILLISMTEFILRGINVYPKLPKVFRDVRVLFPTYVISVFLLFIAGCSGLSKHSKSFNFIRIISCISSMVSAIVLFIVVGQIIQYSFEKQNIHLEKLLRNRIMGNYSHFTF